MSLIEIIDAASRKPWVGVVAVFLAWGAFMALSDMVGNLLVQRHRRERDEWLAKQRRQF